MKLRLKIQPHNNNTCGRQRTVAKVSVARGTEGFLGSTSGRTNRAGSSIGASAFFFKNKIFALEDGDAGAEGIEFSSPRGSCTWPTYYNIVNHDNGTDRTLRTMRVDTFAGMSANSFSLNTGAAGVGSMAAAAIWWISANCRIFSEREVTSVCGCKAKRLSLAERLRRTCRRSYLLELPS
jgi:hypothetical protein